MFINVYNASSSAVLLEIGSLNRFLKTLRCYISLTHYNDSIAGTAKSYFTAFGSKPLQNQFFGCN
jgi:hypothetical protein